MTSVYSTKNRIINHGHLFCGLGGGAKGFNRANVRLGKMAAQFRCVGGIDVDEAAIRDFSRAAGVPGTCLDLFDREQYRAFHGEEPPLHWREAGPHDVRRAMGGEHIHIAFASAPCKGFSGLLSETKSLSAKYQALNRLTLRGIWLLLEAYKDDPVELIVFENVPRIATRGRHLLDQITRLLRSYGYAVRETTHDCGELGGLAQSRKRFLLVARHTAAVPPFLYEPPKRALRGVGDVLDRMPLPGDVERAGPMHRLPTLQWQTWVRLALVEAGSDWRSLNKLRVADGVLADYAITRAGAFGVCSWQDAAGTVAGESLPTNGRFSVADPRAFDAGWRAGVMGVTGWEQATGVVAGRSLPSNGAFSVADPRPAASPLWHDGQHYGVRGWDQSAPTVTAQSAAGGGAYSVADPRHLGTPKHNDFYRVVRWEEAGKAVTGAGGAQQTIADPRCAMNARTTGDHYLTGGHYGVVPWDGTSGAVSSAACHDNGRWSVADPRRLPAPQDRGVVVIQSLDGTWHRPFTTLELAALQSLVDPEEMLELDGLSDQAWRERIGNAVPPDAAQAIAETMGRTLLMAWSGQGFMLSDVPIWVKPVAVALSVRDHNAGGEIDA